MASVIDLFRSILPPRAKPSPSGWMSFNAPCCEHRGHGKDKRKRGGVLIADNSIVFNCFNCKFSAGWKPGNGISPKMRSLCKWLGAPEDTIKEMIFEALKTESADYQPQDQQPYINFENKDLPDESKSLEEWVNDATLLEVAEDLYPVIEYVSSRGFDPLDKNFFWSPSAGYKDRVIVPFYYEGRIVGNTARKITNGKPKYLSDQHPNFLFNIDSQDNDHKYCFVVEGPFDALSIDGVALLTNDISEQHARLIKSIDKEIIVIPDQDEVGLRLIDRAIEFGFGVAFPNWDEDIKDCADAVSKYGKLFVIVDAIQTAQTHPIKIEMMKRNMKRKLDLGE